MSAGELYGMGHRPTWWRRWLGHWRRNGERGLGDTLTRWLGYLGGHHYKRWRRKLGKPCGCARRQARLNSRFPYSKSVKVT